MPVLDEPNVPKWVWCRGCHGVMKIDSKHKTKKDIFKVSYKCKKCKSILRRTYFLSAE